MFLHVCSDHQEQLLCLFGLEKPPLPHERSLGQIFFDGLQLIDVTCSKS